MRENEEANEGRVIVSRNEAAFVQAIYQRPGAAACTLKHENTEERYIATPSPSLSFFFSFFFIMLFSFVCVRPSQSFSSPQSNLVVVFQKTTKDVQPIPRRRPVSFSFYQSSLNRLKFEASRHRPKSGWKLRQRNCRSKSLCIR